MATVQAAIEKIAEYWTTAWWVGAMGIFEKIFQFSAQMVLSILVWRSVTKDAPVWFFAAFVYHILVSGITTLLSQLGWTFWQVEGILALLLLLNVLIIYWAWGDNGGLESEGDEDDEDDEEDDEDDEEEEEEEVTPKAKATAAKKSSAAKMAATLKKKTTAKKPTAKKPAPKKKPSTK
jgi:hypothetical protein